MKRLLLIWLTAAVFLSPISSFAQTYYTCLPAADTQTVVQMNGYFYLEMCSWTTCGWYDDREGFLSWGAETFGECDFLPMF